MPFSARDASGVTQSFDAAGDGSTAPYRPRRATLDGDDAAQGSTADAAKTSDSAGTVTGFLRGLVKWAYERMPASLGQKAKAASVPVVLPSDQDALPVTGVFWQATQPVSGAVALGAGEAHAGEVGGRKTNAAATVTRPANTTAYAVNQVVGGATAGASLFTWANLLRSASAPGSGGYVVKARLRTNQAACVAAFRLWIFYATPAANTADQTAYQQLDADKALTAGYIDFPALTTEGAGSDSAGAVLTPGSPAPGNVPLEVMQPNVDRNLYGVLEAKAAFTPASGQTFWVSLAVEND